MKPMSGPLARVSIAFLLSGGIATVVTHSLWPAAIAILAVWILNQGGPSDGNRSIRRMSAGPPVRKGRCRRRC
jgi:hypothetical protein